jgi:hypothetical protein
MHEPREEALTDVLKERAGKETGLAQDLKPVTDTEYPTTSPSEILHCLHHGRELGERAGAKIIPVRETTRKNDEVGVLEIGVPMPYRKRLSVEKLTKDVQHVLVTISPREDNNRDSH